MLVDATVRTATSTESLHRLADDDELAKLMREIRGNVPPTGDVEATQKRHRRMQRLQQAMTIANNARTRLR